jgi:hypothetical protein
MLIIYCFSAPRAEFVWSFVGEALGWTGYPRDMKDLLSKWLRRGFGVSYQLGLACFAGLSWAIWTVRNKISMQKKFPNSPIDVVYYALSFIQKWKSLMRPLEKTKVELMLTQVTRHTREFSPSGEIVTDIGFI